MRLHSAHPTGPWTFDSVVVHSEAHNVKPFRAPDGTWLIFYVGAIDNVTRKCDPPTANAAAAAASLTFPLPKEAAGPIFIASAARVDAPPEKWEIHGPMTDSVGWHSATNPSPVWFGRNGECHLRVISTLIKTLVSLRFTYVLSTFCDTDTDHYNAEQVHSTFIRSCCQLAQQPVVVTVSVELSECFVPGTIRMMVSRRWDLGGGHNNKNNWLMEADTWRGPYRNLTHSYAEAIKSGEDPDWFRTPRGFHMLNHNTGPVTLRIPVHPSPPRPTPF